MEKENRQDGADGKLQPLIEPEQIYKKLYEQNPDIYFYDKKGRFYKNWNEFAAYYLQTVQGQAFVPEIPPTIMNYVLQESDFFFGQTRDVDIVYNARYCPPFWHHLNFIKIMYVLRGELLINLAQNRTVCLEAGNFVIVPPDIKQSVFSCHDDDWIVNIFLRLSTFEKAFASMLMEADGLSVYFWKILYGKDENSIILFRSPPDMFLEKLILDMHNEVKNPRTGGNFFLISCVMSFMAYAFSRQAEYMAPIMDMPVRDDKFPAVIQYIRENYSTVTLTSLAEQFGMSEGYLSRYIKRETGYSLVQLLKEFRIKQAGIMLRETRCSVEEIMFAVGYTDISYFYKVFKERFGMTPKQYRESEKIIRLR